MDGVFNTIKKGLDDIINKLNQISLFTNKTNENKSVKSAVKTMTYNELKSKNGAETTIFDYNGSGYIDAIQILNFLHCGSYVNLSTLSEFKIIIDDDIFLTIDNIYCSLNTSDISLTLYNIGTYIPSSPSSGFTLFAGQEINIPIKKIIKNNIKCVCKPIRFTENNNTRVICSAWIEER